MGKRQIRITESQLKAQVPSLLNKELNMILKNDVTLHGKITRVDPKGVLFIDSISRKHLISLEEIAEVILDQESAY